MHHRLSTVAPALLASSLVSAGAFANDEIALVRIEAGVAESPQILRIHRAPGTESNLLGPALASDESLGKALGSTPVRFVFAGDADGDGADEIYEVRVKQTSSGKDLRLKGYAPPAVYDGSLGKPVATSLAFSLGKVGKPNGASKIVAIGAGDHDDDGADEALVIVNSAASPGKQSLEVRPLPLGPKGSMATVLASLIDIDAGLDTTILAVCGGDANGDGEEEIVVLKQRTTGTNIEVYAPPQAVGETAQLIASTTNLPALLGFAPTAMCRMRYDGDFADEIGVVLTNAAGTGRFTVYDLPTTVLQPPGTPHFDDVTFDPSTDGLTTAFAFALRGYSFAEPLENVAGTWSATLDHTVPGGPESLVLDHSIFAQQAGSVLTLAFPLFNYAQATYQPSIHLMEFATSPIELNAPGSGTLYKLTLGSALVFAGAEGTFLIGSYTGKKKLPLGQEAEVTAGTYRIEAHAP